MAARYVFSARLWRYPGEAAWHFISVPKAESGRIKKNAPPRRGWGAVKVKAQIGATSWTTSVFPDSKSGLYVLPVKATVRRTEGIDADDTIRVTLETV